MAVNQLNIFRLNGYTKIQCRNNEATTEDEKTVWYLVSETGSGVYISAKTNIAAINKFKNYILDTYSGLSILDIKITDSNSLSNTSGISIMKGTKEEIINNLGNKLKNLKTVYEVDFN